MNCLGCISIRLLLPPIFGVLALGIACGWSNVLGAAALERNAGLPLTKFADVELRGPTNRFDYQSLDPQRHLLFIAHLGAGTVVVFDTEARKVIAEIGGISEVHGVLVVPERKRVYASATGTNEVVVLDEDDLSEVARVPAGEYPDGVAYAPDQRKLYVSDETGRTEAVIDTQSNRLLEIIPLHGEAGNTQYDPLRRKIFVNVQTRGELVEIDPAADRIVARHPLPGAKGNHGLLIEPKRHLAMIACEGNDKLLVLDLETMRVIASETLGKTPDVLAFDDRNRWLYVASEAGVVSVFRVDGKTLVKLGEALLARSAHTVAVDPRSHRVYFPLQNENGRPVLRIMVPDTAHVGLPGAQR